MGEEICNGVCGREMMNCPLYKVDDPHPQTFPQTAHAGLWYERFFNQYDAHWKVIESSKTEKGGKQRWIETVIGKHGDDTLLKQHHTRTAQLLESLGGDKKVYTTNWHFVTGLGLNHPVENGFSWHPTLGVPYLSGSAVKGLLKAWMAQWSGLDEKPEWFGVQDKIGDLIFFDALPTEPVELTLDVMTPHMDKWYKQGGEIKSVKNEPEKVPADWHNPEPVPFLAVKKGSFLFALASRTKDEKNVKEAFGELEKALEILGAGAKTAAGYGRFDYDEKETTALKQDQEKQKEALLPEEAKAVKNLQKLLKDFKATQNARLKSTLTSQLSETFKQAATWDQDYRNQLADFAETAYQQLYRGKAKKKQEKKAKIAQLRENK
jgi:CRISPR-associated protein Cmr6